MAFPLPDSSHPDAPPPRLADIVPAALFLDFDGTLVDFADHPDGVVPPVEVVPVLRSWHERLDGALAIVSGRDIDRIDRFLTPLKLPVAGAHGMMRRRADGTVQTSAIDPQALSHIGEQLDRFAGENPGTLVERKQHSVALHFRRVPHLQGDADQAMTAAISHVAGFSILRGKMVVEARSSTTGKDRAIAAFMQEPPFAGRIPVFAGDDVTDEDGFEAVNRMRGVTIKVGQGETDAGHRLADPEALHRWLLEGAGQKFASAAI